MASTRLRLSVMLSLSLALSALPGYCSAADAAVAAPQQEAMVSVPLSKLTELQSLISRQEQQLNQLQELLGGQNADRAEQLNQSAQAGAADCQKLVEQIRSDNRRAKQIIDELISNAQAGAAQDAAH